MPNGDGTTFAYGGSTYPLTSALTNTLLQDSDPAVYWALQFFSSVITTHLGPRLLLEAGRLGAPIAAAVAYMTPLDPVPYLLEEQFQFPLLAVFRKSEKLTHLTYNWSHTTTQLGVSYVLPPLSAGQAENIVPILSSLGKVLKNRIEYGGDPSFQSGARVWDASHAGLEKIDIVDGSFGLFAGTGDLLFPSWSATLVVDERQMQEPGLSILAAVDANQDLVNAGQTTISDFVDFKSDVTPPGPTTG